MQNAFSFLRPYTFPSIIAFSLMLVELAVELLLPLFLGLMINKGVVQQDIPNIVFWGSVMIGLALLSFVAGVLNSFLASHVSFSYAYDLREKLFEKIQGFSCTYLNKFAASSLITRFTNDIRQIQNTVFMALRIMAKAPLTVLGGVIMAFVVNVQLAPIFLVIVPLLVLFLLWILKISSKRFKQVQNNVDRVNRVMQENLSGMRLIKAFTRRETEENRFDHANLSLAATTRKTFRIIESTGPVLLFVMNMSLIFMIWFGSIQTMNGQASIGEVVTLVNYALRVAMSISMFSFITMALSRTKASVERVNDVLLLEGAQESEKTARGNTLVSKGKIHFDHVSFQYPNTEKTVLTDISFTVEAGEKLAIIGATGSGKSSLFQLIPRLYETTEGNIYIDDTSINNYPHPILRDSIGYAPQTPLLFTGSVFDNITFGKREASMKEVIQAAKDAQIHDTILQLQDQYETRIGQKGVNLSGGQKQRISIARALIRKPKILMLDDSTSALDLTTEATFLQALKNYQCTVLIITQKISTAQQSDRILLLNQGEVLTIGTHEQLLKNSDLYRAMVASQQEKEVAYAK